MLVNREKYVTGLTGNFALVKKPIGTPNGIGIPSGAQYKVLGSDSALVRTLQWSRCTHTGRDFERPKVLHTV